MTQTREQIETRMRDLTDFIVQATDTVKAGRMVGLQHLDDEVASLCESAIALPPEEAVQVQSSMAAMIGRLEELAAALQAFQQQDGAQ